MKYYHTMNVAKVIGIVYDFVIQYKICCRMWKVYEKSL
jgi:hypothetical protein